MATTKEKEAMAKNNLKHQSYHHRYHDITLFYQVNRIQVIKILQSKLINKFHDLIVPID